MMRKPSARVTIRFVYSLLETIKLMALYMSLSYTSSSRISPRVSQAICSTGCPVHVLLHGAGQSAGDVRGGQEECRIPENKLRLGRTPQLRLYSFQLHVLTQYYISLLFP